MGAPGCDDAPIINVARGQHPKPFTVVRAYYDNPDALRHHLTDLDNWHQREARQFRQISLIFVDDGSPKYPAEPIIREFKHLPVRLFRIEVDVRWNWLAARNIALTHSLGDWHMITDMDHVLPLATAWSLMYGLHDRGTIYRFLRQEHTGREIHPHPNSWFMTKDMYWKVGGHDEALSGFYGTDGEYRRRCVAAAPIRIMDDHLVRYERIGQYSTLGYLRKQPMDAEAKRRIKARRPGWSPKLLSFPYHEVTL